MTTTATHPPLPPSPGYCYELAQGEVWTNYAGETVAISTLSAEHAWNILSHTLRNAPTIVEQARRRLNPNGPLPWDVDRRTARFLHRLLDLVPPAQWVQATPAWRAVLAHLVELGELDDPTLAVGVVVQRAEARGLRWEIEALQEALAPVRLLRN